jgi:hypothetical protein
MQQKDLKTISSSFPMRCLSNIPLLANSNLCDSPFKRRVVILHIFVAIPLGSLDSVPYVHIHICMEVSSSRSLLMDKISPSYPGV